MKKVIVILVYSISLALLLGLGVWQLQRGIVKQEIEQVGAENQKPIVISDLSTLSDQSAYKAVTLSGHLLHQTSFSMSHRTHNGQDGVEVLTPLALSNGQAMMVNRGWITKQQLQSLSIAEVSEQVTVSGVLYQPSEGVRIGESILPTENWPKSSLYLDLDSFSDHIGKQLSTYVLVLNEGHPYAFTKIWKAATMSSQKHFGYAIQWFGLAITLVIFGFIWLRKKK